jgi:hypothetical protein
VIPRPRFVVFAVLTGLAACGGVKITDPASPDYASGSQAQEEFQPLRSKWEHGDRASRIALEPELAKHAEKHAKDPTGRIAKAMLALIAIAKGDSGRAEALARLIALGPPGVTRDMALAAQGASLEKAGRSREALAILKPLFGKMIDPFGRDIVNEEVSLAAVAQGDFSSAVRFMRGWVAQAPEGDRDDIERRIAALLDQVPADPLLGLVREVKGTDEIQSPLLKLVGERLAGLAVSGKDVALAKILLAEARPILGDKVDDIARVAAKGAAIRLEPNTVGLLLSLRNEELQRRGLEVSNGLALALGIGTPGSVARVVSRDDQGGDQSTIEDALALLTADGAAVIVAGVDTKEADMASAYAERTNVPVVLLRPPSKPPRADGPVFVVGEDPSAVRGALMKALATGGADKTAILVGTRDDGDVPPAAQGTSLVGVSPCGASLDFLSTQKANGLVIDGSPRCASEAASRVPVSVAVAFGLDAPASVPAHVRATAGLFPMHENPSGGDEDIARFLSLGRGAPTWWAGLGHDAGKLAWAAVSQLPDQAAADTRAMADRKALVTRLVASADVPLWTTDARGFGGGRVLPRTIGLSGEGAKALAPKQKPLR